MNALRQLWAHSMWMAAAAPLISLSAADEPGARKALQQLEFAAPAATPPSAPTSPNPPTPTASAIAMDAVVVSAPEIKLENTTPVVSPEPDLEVAPLYNVPFAPSTGGTMWSSPTGRVRVGMWRWYDIRSNKKALPPPKSVKVDLIRVELGK